MFAVPSGELLFSSQSALAFFPLCIDCNAGSHLHEPIFHGQTCVILRQLQRPMGHHRALLFCHPGNDGSKWHQESLLLCG